MGPSYSNKHVLRAINNFLIKNKNFSTSKIKNNKNIVNYISKGKVLGRFKGRMELGQRALGNRSILADPRKPEIIKLINQKIKMRDFWMPFTPSILSEYKEKYLVNEKNYIVHI